MTEVELLFTELLNCRREELYLNRQQPLSQEVSVSLAQALKRRCRREPIQYILGKTEFMGLNFRLTADVFIPRPETEILVETVIRLIQETGSKKQAAGSRKSFDRRFDKLTMPRTVPSKVEALRTLRRRTLSEVEVQELKILDIGTGSGCIAVSLAKFLPGARITATDISQKALEIAKQNALLNNVDINFLQSDLFSNFELQAMNYELIVSNPPYIPVAEIKRLEPELAYEPRIALEAGPDGLDFYRLIIKQAPAYLKRGGFLLFEMGYNQCAKIKKLFNYSHKFEIIEVIRDYNNIERVMVARYG